MKELGKIIIDGYGTEKEVYPVDQFPDKKPRPWTHQQVDTVLEESRAVVEKFELGQTEASFFPNTEYPHLPIVISLMTDTHYGSIRTNTELLNKHLEVIKSTPNFFLAHNGDHTDNFNATGKWAMGMAEDPLPTQIASRAWAEKLLELDEKNKVAVLGFGNHDNFGEKAGQDYHDTFLGRFKCPIFTTGGLLHVRHGNQQYDLAMTHMYWGTSKLNPTNANKRFMDFEYPDADISFLGHTHQSEGLHFEKGGKDRIACIGGTYKDEDNYARKWGIGGRSGSPGWAIALYPYERAMILFNSLDKAQDFIKNQIR